MKILLSEAHTWVSASRSKIYADAQDGRLSTTPHPQNERWKAVDIAELERVYGTVRDPKERPKDAETDATGLSETLKQQYENRIHDLTQQLQMAANRETTLTEEKSKLLDMLSAEQQKTRQMLTTTERRVPSWIRRVFGDVG